MGPLLRSSGDMAHLNSQAHKAMLQWGRCFAAAETPPAAAAANVSSSLQWGRCFAAAETWDEGLVPHGFWSLQWGRCFAAAETAQREAHQVEVPLGFNGAAASQQRRHPAEQRGAGLLVASMGPLLRSSGDRPAPGTSPCSRPGFNGAAASQQRRRGRHGNRRFDLPASMGPLLRSSGDDGAPGRALLRVAVASMGPLLRSSGDIAPPADGAGMSSCFNGAAASQQRRQGISGGTGLQARVLQWGRCFAAAETTDAPKQSTAMQVLQWGRCFAAAETPVQMARRLWAELLQWGRCFAAAETTALPGSRRRSACFNGAAASQQRRRRAGSSARAPTSASMGYPMHGPRLVMVRRAPHSRAHGQGRHGEVA